MSWLAAAGHHVGKVGARRHEGLACELLNREVFTQVLQPPLGVLRELGVLGDLGDLGEGIRADDARGEFGWSAPGRRRAGEAPPFDG